MRRVTIYIKALRYAFLCIVTRLISDVHFHITGPKLTFNSEMTQTVYTHSDYLSTFAGCCSRSLYKEKKEETQSITKAPTPSDKFKMQRDNTKTPPKTSRRIINKVLNVCPFDYTAFEIGWKVGIP